MRFFTRECANGELADEDTDRVADAYRSHVESIFPGLPPELQRLAREIDLHDGLVERVEWNEAAIRLTLNLVVAAPPSVAAPYAAVQLTYDGTLLGPPRLGSLRRAAESRSTEILFDEVDLQADSTFAHRILFSPSEQVTIEFATLDVTISPRSDRRVELLHPFREV